MAIKTTNDVTSFLATVDEHKQKDSEWLIAAYQDITGQPPKLWHPGIIGFGKYHYKYASGREGDSLAAGFSPRKAALTLYLNCDASKYSALLEKLGPHTLGKGCLYIKNLDDVDRNVLTKLLRLAYKDLLTTYY